MVQYPITRLIFMIKTCACNTHCLDFTRIKSLKCNNEHIAFSGLYHGATKTCTVQPAYKVVQIQGMCAYSVGSPGPVSCVCIGTGIGELR